jgi:iron complex outermembrane receptor protein
MDSSGVVRCGTPGAVVGGCVPFNIIGGPSASTPEALNYVMSAGSRTYGNTTKSWLGDITGTLFDLPAGPLGMAAGLEYRDQSGYTIPGQFERSGLSTDLAGNPTVGSYTVKEGYLEFQIPILRGVTMADTLSFNISGRYSDYSTYGNTTNGKYSMLWRPYKDLMVRGTYADGFRAPTIGDTAGGGSQSFDSYLDPCDSANGAAAKDPAIKARCNAAGVPTNFRQLNQAGNPVSAGGGQTPYPFNAGAGNSDLQPETATTQTLGLIFSPAQVSGLTLAFDWYKIEIEDVITGISAGYVLNQCYVSGNSAFCDDFKRDSTGQVVTLNRGNANLGGIKTAGYDFGVYHRLPTTKWGNFGVRWDNTYVDYFKQQATAGGEWTDYAGYYDGYAYYKWRSNLNLDWSMGSWSVTWGMRYYDSIKGQCWSSTEDCTSPTEESPTWGPGVNRIGSQTFHDVSVAYKFSWKGQILAGINNVFAKDPTVNISSNYTLNGPSSSSSVDPNLPIDRFFWIRYNQYF